MAAILIVDDDELVRRFIHVTLSAASHDVRVASGPREALEILRRVGCFDLIVSDIQMPLMDGHELTRLIAVHCPTSRVLHIAGSDTDCDSCPYIDKCPVVAKPFTSEKLMNAVECTLSNPRLNRHD
jgi:CheY-like chemotaxis protein